MPLEIERRFLVAPAVLPEVLATRHGDGVRIVQGYLTPDPDRALRVRLAGDSAVLTLKGRKTGGAGLEVETAIPMEIAQALLSLCGSHVVVKTRYRIPHGNLTIELDVFERPRTGLVIAEIELPSIDTPLTIPPWFGPEITDDPRHANQTLAFES